MFFDANLLQIYMLKHLPSVYFLKKLKIFRNLIIIYENCCELDKIFFFNGAKI